MIRAGTLAATAALLLSLTVTAGLSAQTTEYDATFLRDLPTSDNLFAVLETMQPSVVSDRFSAGGLYSGQPARIGGFLSSWTQTLFRIDGVTITDPNLTGTPFAFPELALWRSVKATTGMMSADTNAEGLAVDLLPVLPGTRWARTVDGSISHLALTGSAPGATPAIARLDGWDRAVVTASGPLVAGRLGATFSASWTRGSQFYRSERFPMEANVGSVFSHIAFTPNDRDQIRLVTWLQRNVYPIEQRVFLAQPKVRTRDTSGHAQAVWTHSPAPERSWRAAASYSGRRRRPDDTAGSPIVFERLVDGPVQQIASIARGTTEQWSLAGSIAGNRADATGVLRGFNVGADATGGRHETASFFSGVVGETVDGVPARLWNFATSAGRKPSLRTNVAAGLFAEGRVQPFERLPIDIGLRFQSQTGSAAGAATGISWRALLPRVRATWALSDRWQLHAFAGYARSMLRLGLDYLAIGDPAAPAGEVFQWLARPGATPSFSNHGAFIARLDPGSIDPSLKPPVADEIVLGVEARPRSGILLRLAGVVRRERSLPALVNVGAPPASAYSSFTIRDPGGDVLNPDDDQVLSVFNRLPASFGSDRYLLTNTGDDPATFEGLELTIQIKTRRLTLMGGGTAGRARASAASRGFGPLENDATVLGEVLADPNAATLARGRLFTDRAYTAKFATVFQLPAGFRAGAIARYQDGQPFSRVLVFTNLNQGAEAIRAFSNGESRFMFVGTLDARVQKGLSLGGRRFEIYVDAYNLLDLSNSVEEDVAAPPDVRIATALQPPRAFHVGVRVAF